MKRVEVRPCDVCRGTGLTPVECTGTDPYTGLKHYRAKPFARLCSKCSGKGERLVTVSDERDERDAMDEREDVQARADFIRVQELHR